MVLTVEALLRAYDRLWDNQPERHWYLCHPDDAPRVRAFLGAARPGKQTCPLLRVSRWAIPGRVTQIAIDDRVAQPWPWQRQEE